MADLKSGIYPVPEVSVLSKLFSYNPMNGDLTNLISRGSRAVAGLKTSPHSIRINGLLFAKRRVVWKMMTGEDPDVKITHANKDHTDCRWSNLKLQSRIPKHIVSDSPKLIVSELPLKEQLDKLFTYSIISGSLYTAVGCGNKKKGSLLTGPRVIINGKRYRISRIIWKIVTGCDPSEIIDHHDGNTCNNSWLNLREATTYQNNWNRALKYSSKKNGVTGKGVGFEHGKFYAGICCKGVRHKFGPFDTEEQASLVYQVASDELFGTHSVTRRPGRIP